jgi:glutamyl-tRNA synthetase
MFEDLRWLGITWSGEVVTQSQRLDAYRDALKRLLAAGWIYPCRCSRKDLLRMMHAPHEDTDSITDDEPVYPGVCRPIEREPARHFEMGVNYRFRVPEAEKVGFEDGNLGPQCFLTGRDFGDFLVWRKDGLPSYQLACVVDDAAMAITEVVRGRDLLKSTARQRLLQRALGLASPAYFHTELMVDGNGARLAKRHDALALRTLRQQGLTPDEVLRMIPVPTARP